MVSRRLITKDQEIADRLNKEEEKLKIIREDVQKTLNTLKKNLPLKYGEEITIKDRQGKVIKGKVTNIKTIESGYRVTIDITK